MKFSENIAELAKALADAQTEMRNPYNTANNPYFKSKYAPLPDILNVVRPVLAKYGLTLTQYPVTDEDGGVGVESMLLHKSGQYIQYDPYFLTPAKNDPQTAGGAITYARRYALNAVLGISGEEDDDGNGASGKKSGKPDESTDFERDLAMGQIISIVDGVTTAQEANAAVATIKGMDLSLSIKKEASGMLAGKCKALGLVLDKETKTYRPAVQ